MKYKFQYNSEEELLKLKEEHSDKALIKIEILFSGNFVTFDDDMLMIETIKNSKKISTLKISTLETESKSLKEGLQAVLNGDMQSLAYILYPEDFTDVNNTTLEL